jgi:hypothetical protein
MDAIGADQHVAVRGAPVRAMTIEEVGGDAALILLEVTEPMPCMQTAFAERETHRLINHALQPAAMHGELRHVIAGVDAARLAPYLLAEAIGIDQLVGADRDGIEPFHQPELLQFLDGMRQRVDTDAKLADALGLLEQFAVDAAGVQHQSRRQPPDPSADDDHLHGRRPSTARQELLDSHYSPADGWARNRFAVTWLTRDVARNA